MRCETWQPLEKMFYWIFCTAVHLFSCYVFVLLNWNLECEGASLLTSVSKFFTFLHRKYIEIFSVLMTRGLFSSCTIHGNIPINDEIPRKRLTRQTPSNFAWTCLTVLPLSHLVNYLQLDQKCIEQFVQENVEKKIPSNSWCWWWLCWFIFVKVMPMLITICIGINITSFQCGTQRK